MSESIFVSRGTAIPIKEVKSLLLTGKSSICQFPALKRPDLAEKFYAGNRIFLCQQTSTKFAKFQVEISGLKTQCGCMLAYDWDMTDIKADSMWAPRGRMTSKLIAEELAESGSTLIKIGMDTLFEVAKLFEYSMIMSTLNEHQMHLYEEIFKEFGWKTIHEWRNKRSGNLNYILIKGIGE